MTDPQAIVRLLRMHQSHRRKLDAYAEKLRNQVAATVARLEAPDAGLSRTTSKVQWPALEHAAARARTLPPQTQEKLLTSLPYELAEELERAIYSFDALPTLPRRSIQDVLRKASGRDVALALIGADDAVGAAVLDNVSARAATILREDRDSLIQAGTVSVSDVTVARDRLAALIRQAWRGTPEK